MQLRRGGSAFCLALAGIAFVTGMPLARGEGGHDEMRGGATSGWNARTEPRRHALWGSKAEMGEWYRVPLTADPKDRMQAIHSILLPNGKVLMVSGSSFRLILKDGVPIEALDGSNPVNVNQSALFDPERVSFRPLETSNVADDPDFEVARASFQRIATPETPFQGEPNDIFCAGHLHTPDGNVLFVSGTRINAPTLLFPGHLCANVFDWKKETWRTTKPLKDGHWYPSMLALPDGRIAALSGFKRDFDGKPPLPRNSHWMEIYDHRSDSWSHVDISKDVADGPFTSQFTYNAVKTDAANKPVLDKEGNPVLEQRKHTDELDHYPRVMPLPDGRFLVTGDGSGGGNPLCHYTYLMRIDLADPARPKVIFEKGANRPEERRIYGTALIDPNSPQHDLLLMGGMLNGPNTASLVKNPSAVPPKLEGRSAMFGPYRDPLPEEKKDFVTTDMYRYRAPIAAGDTGTWETTQNFLGDRLEDKRMQAVSVILPTKEFVVMGGGNYFFDRPIFSPRLFTPDSEAPGGYRSRQLNPCTQPRLYHSVALLLPDGRIFTASGNAARATLDGEGKGPGDVYRYNFIKRHPIDNTYGFVDSGEYRIPSENHQIELFSPPYLFIKGARPKFTLPPEGELTGKRGQCLSLPVQNSTESASLVLIKLGSITHGWDMGQRLIDLAASFKQDPQGVVSFEVPKDPVHCPPGYYMLFYVNGRGQPVEKAAMVKVE